MLAYTMPLAYTIAEDAKASTSKATGTAGAAAAAEEPVQPTFLAFAGSGKRLDGKTAPPSQPVPVPLPGTSAGVFEDLRGQRLLVCRCRCGVVVYVGMWVCG
jgi:hypothetical protein